VKKKEEKILLGQLVTFDVAHATIARTGIIISLSCECVVGIICVESLKRD
jgi:hypothetical protein